MLSNKTPGNLVLCLLYQLNTCIAAYHFPFSLFPHHTSVCLVSSFPNPRCSQVCREFQRGNCARGETDCRFAHPSDSPMIDTSDNTVTVCMDYIKSRCSREKCKYFHPPAHLQAKIKAAQHQANQTAVAAQAAATAAAMVRAPRINSHTHKLTSC